MPHLPNSLRFLLPLSLTLTLLAQSHKPPQAAISNGLLHAVLYLPDRETGFYRGTRFDWSGVIRSLEFDHHNYYGPWFNKTDPDVIDFIFHGADIVAGPCSAITGPVEEFSTGRKALGFDQAKPGGNFIKIGIGVLRRPDDRDYNPYRLYQILDPGKWLVTPNADSVEFSQDLSDPESGYAYRYTKTVRLKRGKPEMVIAHKLVNTGHRVIETSVYDHNFLVLDGQPTGPGFTLKLPFDIKTQRFENAQLADVRGREFTYRKPLTDRDTVSAEISGFGKTAADYNIQIENSKAGAGMRVVGDRPLSEANLWSIRSVLAMEPFISMSIAPGKSFTWTYTYTYYSLK